MATIDRSVTFESSKKYPSIPTIGGDTQSHSVALNLMKQALEIHERRTPDIFSSFVRVQELVDLGLATVRGNQLNNTAGSTDASQQQQDLSALTAQVALNSTNITLLQRGDAQARTQRYFLGE